MGERKYHIPLRNRLIPKVIIIPVLLFTLIILMGACNKKEEQDERRYFHDHTTFIMGADLSYVNQILDKGGEYRDSGRVEDPYSIFSKYGTNTVRLRLWHNPVWTAELYGPGTEKIYNGFEDVALAASRAREEGMSICLDFHYSDNWADPQKQVIPAAWQGLTADVLGDSLYNYTFKTLRKLDAMGLMPEYVQVGNEINPGFLLPSGDRWIGNGESFLSLLNRATDAVRDASAGSEIKSRIILHIAQPDHVDNWFAGIEDRMPDFDILGISYYYIWSEVRLDQLSWYISSFSNRYGKDVMVVETAYPFTTANADTYPNIIDTSRLVNGYPATPGGQLDYLVAMTREIAEGGGKGLIYWEPAWITSPLITQWGSGSAWDCNTLFNFEGETIESMNFMTRNYEF
ncbi:MAG: arabinogalactan endo-1,4-beta-galactosidase [Bacteroidales bacterium]|nr:arabinogalactan endo-1,4-beta-galactosidase [Bacteroidales bacterium]